MPIARHALKPDIRPGECRPLGEVSGHLRVRNSVMVAVGDKNGATAQLADRFTRPDPRSQRTGAHDRRVAGARQCGPATHRVADEQDLSAWVPPTHLVECPLHVPYPMPRSSWSWWRSQSGWPAASIE